MKYLLLLTCVLLSACAHTAKITPRTDLAPLRSSNAETRKAIKSSKTHIEASQTEAKKGETSLDDARTILEKLLNRKD